MAVGAQAVAVILEFVHMIQVESADIGVGRLRQVGGRTGVRRAELRSI